MSSQPHRHDQPCRNVGLSFEELQAQAGKWNAYPQPDAVAHVCPSCGTPLTPLARYCDRECYYVAQRRQAHSLAQSRRLEEGVGGYSWPIPMKGDK